MSSPNQNKDEIIASQAKQIKELTDQLNNLNARIDNLTKLLFGSKSEKRKYQPPVDGQLSIFEEDEQSFSAPEHRRTK